MLVIIVEKVCFRKIQNLSYWPKFKEADSIIVDHLQVINIIKLNLDFKLDL